MSAAEVARFEANEIAEDAVRLRRWDDLAKEEGALVPSLGHYRAILESVMRPATGAAGAA
jgi:predicted HD phosphohydrolase